MRSQILVLLAAVFVASSSLAREVNYETVELDARQQRGGQGQNRGGQGGQNKGGQGGQNQGGQGAQNQGGQGQQNNNQGSSASDSSQDFSEGGNTLDTTGLCTGCKSNGLNENSTEAGQSASITSSNNYINFCVEPPQAGTAITNGLQNKAGSCNPVPMGMIPATTNMVSSKFKFPANLDTIAANQDFTVQLQIQNLVAGDFTNPAETYFSAPCQLADDGSGNLKGHSHFVITSVKSLTDTTVQPATDFEFFLGLNSPAQGGILSGTVKGGVPAGVYKMGSIHTCGNHQPVPGPVAQHALFDDVVYFTVQDGGANGNAGSSASGNAGTGNAGNAGAGNAGNAGNGNAGNGNAGNGNAGNGNAGNGNANAGNGKGAATGATGAAGSSQSGNNGAAQASASSAVSGAAASASAAASQAGNGQGAAASTVSAAPATATAAGNGKGQQGQAAGGKGQAAGGKGQAQGGKGGFGFGRGGNGGKFGGGRRSEIAFAGRDRMIKRRLSLEN